MKRFLLSVSLLSTLLAAGYYNSARATPVTQSALAAPAPIAKLPAGSLPVSAKTYLDQHFAGYTLIRVEKVFADNGRNGVPSGSESTTRRFAGTQVRFLISDTPFDLFFDAAGKMAGTRAPGPRGESDVTSYLTASQLPAPVKDYLNKSYRGYTLLKAASHPSPSGSAAAYDVEILANSQRANLHFDSTGTFRDARIHSVETTGKQVSYVSRKELPAAVTQVLTSQYADLTYVLGEQHTGGPNGTSYVVELAKDSTLTRLHVDASGNILTPPAGPRGMGPDEDRPGDRGPGKKGPDRGPAARPDDKKANKDEPAPPAPGRHRPAPDGPRAGMPQRVILDANALPAAITSYLKTTFGGYTFLKATTPNRAGESQYTTDIAVGKALYKFRFAGTGDVLMAEAKN